jgi:beta-glucosidase
LPISLPKKLEDSPAHALGTYPGGKTKVEYLEDIFVGYRWFDKMKIAPLYPFGYGLSYTNFTFEKMASDKIVLGQNETAKVSITVKNSGKITGKEVVQLYVSAINPKEDRTITELKAFQKIELKAGEQQTIDFEIKPEMLRYYSNIEDKWVIPTGKYKLLIGNSSRNCSRRSHLPRDHHLLRKSDLCNCIRRTSGWGANHRITCAGTLTEEVGVPDGEPCEREHKKKKTNNGYFYHTLFLP